MRIKMTDKTIDRIFYAGTTIAVIIMIGPAVIVGIHLYYDWFFETIARW